LGYYLYSWGSSILSGEFMCSNTSRRYLRSATHGDLQVPRTRTVICELRSLLFLVLLSGTLCHRPYVYRPLYSNSFRVD